MLTNVIHPSPLSPLMLGDIRIALRISCRSYRSRVVVSGLLTGRYLPASPLKDTAGGTAGSSMVVHMEQLLTQLHVAQIRPNRTAFVLLVWSRSAAPGNALLSVGVTHAQTL